MPAPWDKAMPMPRHHPEVVRAVHEDYIRAGADVIIANTFATSALLFNALGRDSEMLEIDRAAVAIAKAAAKGHHVAVAGSMSTMRPVAPGSDRTLKQREWPEAQARALFQQLGMAAELGQLEPNTPAE